MEIKGWKYYNHAAVPTCAPHEMPDLTPIKDGTIWKLGDGKHKPLLARWTENWDCGYDTGWYYTILDKPFNINQLKAKRRYIINQGIKFFSVETINPSEYAQQLEYVTQMSYTAYPSKYRPVVCPQEFRLMISRWQREIDNGKAKLYVAHLRDTDEICGYLYCIERKDVKESSMMKTIPEYEKYQVNAALVYRFVVDSETFINAGGYLSNGSKTINHETEFNEYLEKYFGFKKAFCKLRIEYRPGMQWIINTLFFLRKLLERLDEIGIIHSINAILKMEYIARKIN